MRRFIGIALALSAAACASEERETAQMSAAVTEAMTREEARRTEAEARARAEAAEAARVAELYPLEGVVRLFQAAIKARPARDADPLGFIRRGERFRARAVQDQERTTGCKGRWLELHPEGFVCEGFDVLVGEELQKDHRELTPPHHHEDLPYDYYFVTLPDTPVMRRAPSPREREAVLTWLARLRHHRRSGPEDAERFLAGELADEPVQPRVVERLLARGYYISSPKGLGAGGRYVRNAQGEYLFADTLRKVDPSELQGAHLGDELTLPLGFVTRPVRPLRVVEDEDGVRFVEDPDEEPLPRYTLARDAKPAELRGDFLVHELGDGRVLKDWFLGVAERIEPPFRAKADEVWIHVDVGEQTLVLYRGEEPVFATLVATGVDGHDTPFGLFEIDKKFVGRTMNDVSPDTPRGDRYRIEDVPFTQYFKGSFALHAAFWHDRFGTRRSHGCVNLSPHDARLVFEATRPDLHEGWFGTYARAAGEGTRIYITP